MARHSTWGCAAALLLAGLSSAAAQATPKAVAHLHHQGWSRDEGLPVAGVARLARTPDGYLWFGSSAGLVRFDGVRFTVLRSDQAPALHSALPGETVPLLVERDGTLWISRSDGALVTRRDGQFRVEIPADPKRSAIRSMVQDGQARIWLLAGRSLLTVRAGRISPATLPTGVPDTSVLAIAPDTGTGLWVGTTTQGLWHVTTSGARHFPSRARGDVPGVRPLLQSADGTLWAAGDHLQILRGTRWTPLTVDRGAGIPATAAAEGALCRRRSRSRKRRLPSRRAVPTRERTSAGSCAA